MTQEKPELLFEDLAEGRTFRTLEYPVTEELVEQYMDAVGDRHPLYSDAAAGPLEMRIAPPGLAAIYSRLSYLQEHTMPSGGVLAKQSFEFQAPVRIGDCLKVQASVFERFEDSKGHRRVHFLIEAYTSNGDPVSTTRLYAIWPK
ncbi:MAG: MaoC family dehydratase [Desulfobacteraceae bacterium]